MDKKQGKLIRSINLRSATVLVVSSVIGSSIFKKIAPMSAELLSPKLVLLAWVLAGLISLAGALSNAEIAGMFADSGGEYVYFKRIYGKFFAFIYGWTNFAVIKTSAISAIAYVFAQSLNAIYPLPKFSSATESLTFLYIFRPLDNFGVKLLAICLIIALTFINTRGLAKASFISNAITKMVVLGLGFVVIGGLFFSQGSLSNFQTNAANFVPESAYSVDFIKAMFGAMLAAFFGYEGWNTLGFLGGEIQNPNKNLPIALFGGMLMIISIYVLVNFTYLYVLPVDKIIQIYQSKNGITALVAIQSFWGRFGSFCFTLLILFTTMGCTNTTIMMASRIYFAMASDGLFFKSAARINPRYNTPTVALWMQGLWSSLLVLSGSFDQLTDMLIFAAFFFYGATSLGVFILRHREPNLERPYKVWGYPFVPFLFLVFSICLIIITLFTHPREAGMGIALMLTGVPFYFYWKHQIKTTSS